jgi:hypothetical protein
MEKSLISLKAKDENQELFKCSGCNGTFKKPLLATVCSHGYAQTYYACPRCLAKVGGVMGSKNNKDVSPLAGKVKRAVINQESTIECKHFLGYLKQRPKSISIPDECLVCDKIVECLTH